MMNVIAPLHGLTIYAIGTLGNQTGFLPITILGSLGGTFGGLFIGAASRSLAPFFVISSLSGTLSFNLTRRYETLPDAADRSARAPTGLQVAIRHLPPRPGNASLVEVTFEGVRGRWEVSTKIGKDENHRPALLEQPRSLCSDRTAS